MENIPGFKKDLMNMLSYIARVRNVDITYVIETLRLSLISGLKRRFGKDSEPVVEVNQRENDIEIKIFLNKKVVEKVENPAKEVSIEEARGYVKEPSLGEVVRIPIPLESVGRVAIQKAAEEMMIKMREAEKTKLYNEYKRKKGEIVSGTVYKMDPEEITVRLGLVDAYLPRKEQLRTDHYRIGMTVKAYVYRVDKTPIGPRIYLSRTHPEFLRKLLERESPEIREGIVEIKKIARIPGFRAKVAVFTTDPNIDPIGACVGVRRTRIENVLKELSGEKIDIIQWSRDPIIFVSRALGPAKVLSVIKEDETYIAIVPDSEFSVAIGKKGQNVWLASLLTGTKIEVLKESEYRMRIIIKKAENKTIDDINIPDNEKELLKRHGLTSCKDILLKTDEELNRVTGLAITKIKEIKDKIKENLG